LAEPVAIGGGVGDEGPRAVAGGGIDSLGQGQDDGHQETQHPRQRLGGRAVGGEKDKSGSFWGGAENTFARGRGGGGGKNPCGPIVQRRFRIGAERQPTPAALCGRGLIATLSRCLADNLSVPPDEPAGAEAQQPTSHLKAELQLTDETPAPRPRSCRRSCLSR